MRSVVLAAALVAAPVAAEPVAARWVAYSPDGRHVAEMDPWRWETAVYRIDRGGERHYEWSMPGWFSRVSLANGGDHVVVGEPDGGLVTAMWQPSDVMLRFFERGHLVREVTIAEIVPDPKEMLPVYSGAYRYWGRAKGFDGDGFYVVETIDHTLRFATETGRVESRE
jgi:hypothetical protein